MREVGGLGVYLATAVSEGILDGPAIYAAGAILSTTGGHGDLHCYPLSFVTDFAHQDGTLRLADGTAECMRATREQLRRGARLIKVCASGGVLSELDSPIHQQFTGAELRAIVEVAALADRVVAAHCHGKPGIMAAIEAGVATIEHGTYLDEEACDAMVETGTILVPTRSIIEDILANFQAVPPYAAAKLSALAATHADAVRMAIERGVTIAMGTDTSVTGMDLLNSWGHNGSELVHLVALGMSPLQAIAAATAVAPRTIGPQAPRSGQRSRGIRRRLHHARQRSPRRHLGDRAAWPHHGRLDCRAQGEGLILPRAKAGRARHSRAARPAWARSGRLPDCRRPVLERWNAETQLLRHAGAHRRPLCGTAGVRSSGWARGPGPWLSRLDRGRPHRALGRGPDLLERRGRGRAGRSSAS